MNPPLARVNPFRSLCTGCRLKMGPSPGAPVPAHSWPSVNR